MENEIELTQRRKGERESKEAEGALLV